MMAAGAGVRAGPWHGPWAPVVVVAAGYLAFLFLGLAALGFDPTRFVKAGAEFVAPAAAPSGLAVIDESSGYDGQFFYRLVLNPLWHQRSASVLRASSEFFVLGVVVLLASPAGPGLFLPVCSLALWLAHAYIFGCC